MQIKWEERWYRCDTQEEYHSLLFAEITKADTTYKEYVTEKTKYLYFQPSWGKQ